MKKALIVVLSILMSAMLMLGIVACKNGTDDAEKVKDALDSIRILHESEVETEETAGNYVVNGRVKVGDDFYDIEWSISSTAANYQEYVSIGEMNPEDSNRTVTITPGDEKVEYTLKATVTIGKASDSIEFKHSIPAASNVLSVAQVIALANGLAADAYYTENDVITPVLVKGYVVDAGSWNSQYNNLNKVYIADEPNGETKFYVYRIVDDSVYNTKEGAIEQDDLITVSGPLQNYKGNTPELTPTKTPAIDVKVTALVKQPTLNDEQKVAKAKAEIEVPESYNAITEITLPSTKRTATLNWAEKTDASNLVTVENNVLKIENLPAEETEVTLTVTIKSGTVTDTKDFTIKVSPAPVEEKIYTVAEVKELAATLAKDAYYEENGAAKTIKVKGYVVDTGSFNIKYSNWSNVYIADELDGTEKFLIFRLGLDNTYLKADGDLKQDDLITVEGYLQNYRGNTPELTYQGDVNPVCVALEKTTLTDAQKVARALKRIQLPATITEAGELPLPASAVDGVTLSFVSDNAAIAIADGKMTVTPGDADITVKITATAAIEGSVSDTKDFEIVVKKPIEASLLATFALGENVAAGTHADGSSATTYSETQGDYTLNVTDGTKLYTGANDKQGNSCFKMGTSSAVGSFKFTVGENVKQVVIYVAGYKARTTKVSVNSGDAVEITEKSDDGEYYKLVIDTTTTKEITISTDASAARCMINTIEFWG